MTHLGFLYPGYAAEDDYPRMAERLPSDVNLEVVHTQMELDAHEVNALLDVGSSRNLRDGARSFRTRPDAVVWACTSGSFVFGPDGAREQVRDLAEACGTRASSTSWAFTNAIAALGVRRVAIAATYPEDIARRFEDFLGAEGIEVVAVGHQGIVTAAEVGTLGRDRVLSFVTGGDHPRAEAVLVPDTALHTVAWLDDLEEALGKPVLTANQVSVWEALRLAEAAVTAEGLGRLFRVDPVSRSSP